MTDYRKDRPQNQFPKRKLTKNADWWRPKGKQVLENAERFLLRVRFLQSLGNNVLVKVLGGVTTPAALNRMEDQDFPRPDTDRFQDPFSSGAHFQSFLGLDLAWSEAFAFLTVDTADRSFRQ